MGKTSIAQYLFTDNIDLGLKEEVKGRLVVNQRQCEVTISHNTDTIDPITGDFKLSNEFVENTSDAYIIVHSMEDAQDLDVVMTYLRLMRSREISTITTPVFLVCNKRDLWSDRDPRWDKFFGLKEIAKRNNVLFLATSTKRNEKSNIDVLFYHLVRLIRFIIIITIKNQLKLYIYYIS